MENTIEINHRLASFIYGYCLVAVDVFIIISGYFLINNNKRTLGKILDLYVLSAVYYIFRNIPQMINGDLILVAKNVVYAFMPHSYFVNLYCVLYCISPLLNKAVSGLSKETFKKSLTIILIIFVIWPTAINCLQALTGKSYSGSFPVGLSGSDRGFTIVNFVSMYLIGGYIRLYGASTIIKRPLIIYYLVF